MKLIYLSSGAVQQFCAQHPIEWCSRELAEQGDILTPTPGMQVFFAMLLEGNRLFDQAQYYAKACAVWGDWLARLDEKERQGIKARLYRNFYPSAIDSLHAWALLVETGLFDACLIDPLADSRAKTDITVFTKDRRAISIALYAGSAYARRRTQHKRQARGGAPNAIDVILPMDRPQRPGNKRWYEIQDFGPVLELASCAA